MSIFTYHLAESSVLNSIRALGSSLRYPGLLGAECTTAMTLGSPVLSAGRARLGQLSVFAHWQQEAALEAFLQEHWLGKVLARGWHTRLLFLRQWGRLQGFELANLPTPAHAPHEPVVAVTLARMKLSQLPRFIYWGRPVEKLVRDHPATTLAMASIRLPRTVSTFSVWTSQQEMEQMVYGKSAVPRPKRHAEAMKERNRKDFHYQFTTLRFKAVAEYGSWQGRTGIIPQLTTAHELRHS